MQRAARGARRAAARATRRCTSSARTASRRRPARPRRSWRATGSTVGAYVSPHVRGWSERIRVAGAEADFERSGRAGAARSRSGSSATQFETLTAAALARVRRSAESMPPSSRRVSADASTRRTFSTRASCVLTNVALEHTDVLGDTREAIAAEKLAVVQPGATVVLGEPEWEALAARERRRRGRRHRAEQPRARGRGGRGVPRAPVDGTRRRDAARPARAARRGAARDLGRRPQPRRRRLPARRGCRAASYVVVASILADKDVDAMLAALSALGRALVATESRSPRRSRQGTSPHRADRTSSRCRADRRSRRGRAGARARGPRRRASSSRAPSIFLPSSSGRRPTTAHTSARRLSVFALAAFVLARDRRRSRLPPAT